jgi:hypothetical protein
MTTPGFAGKILLVNLTNKQISALDSAKYEAYGGGHGTDSDNCAEATWYSLAPPNKPTPSLDQWKAADLAQKLGLNAFEICFQGPMSFPSPPEFPIQPALPAYTGMGWYLKKMYDFGVIGPGKKVDTYPLPMADYEKEEFAEIYALAIAKRIGIGNLLAEGDRPFRRETGQAAR